MGIYKRSHSGNKQIIKVNKNKDFIHNNTNKQIKLVYIPDEEPWQKQSDLLPEKNRTNAS